MSPDLDVSHSQGSYPIYVVERGYQALPALLGAPRQVALVCNPTVGGLYAEAVAAPLRDAGIRVIPLGVPDGEAHKTLPVWSDLVNALLGSGVDRGTPVLALGGGVTGDLVGFAAATVLRGLPLVMLPTTLLAMVDSSVGGKTAVNTAHGKNLVGAFYPPILVYAALDTLSTLPEDELKSGLGEVVKHALLAEPALAAQLLADAPAIRARDPRVLAAWVATCCRIKAAVVASDERETGPRALLNLGHTVGHALETAAGHGVLRHGEAVAMGLLVEARWAAASGRCAPDMPERVLAILRALDLAESPPPLARSAVLQAAGHDKKSRSGTLNMPVVRSLGHAELVPLPSSAIPDLIAHIPNLLEA